jgi:hypothetical protein
VPANSTAASAVLNIVASDNIGAVAFAANFNFATSVAGSNHTAGAIQHGAGGLVGFVRSQNTANISRTQVNLLASVNSGHVFMIATSGNGNNDARRGVGGLIGVSNRGDIDITHSRNDGRVDGRIVAGNHLYISVGGIIGRASNSAVSITSSLNTGDMSVVGTGSQRVEGGGLVGETSGSNAADTNISGSANTGGMTGQVVDSPGLVNGPSTPDPENPSYSSTGSGANPGAAGDLANNIEQEIEDEIAAITQGAFFIEIPVGGHFVFSTTTPVERPIIIGGNEVMRHRVLGDESYSFTVTRAEGYSGNLHVFTRTWDPALNSGVGGWGSAVAVTPTPGGATSPFNHTINAAAITADIKIEVAELTPEPRSITIPKGVGYTISGLPASGELVPAFAPFIGFTETGANANTGNFTTTGVAPTNGLPNGRALSFILTTATTHNDFPPTVTVGGVSASVARIGESNQYTVTFTVVSNNPTILINVTRNTYTVTPPTPLAGQEGTFIFQRTIPALTNNVLAEGVYEFTVAPSQDWFTITTVQFMPEGGSWTNAQNDSGTTTYRIPSVLANTEIRVETTRRSFTLTVPAPNLAVDKFEIIPHSTTTLQWGSTFNFDVRIEESHNQTMPEIRHGADWETGTQVQLAPVLFEGEPLPNLFTGSIVVTGTETMFVGVDNLGDMDDYKDYFNKYQITYLRGEHGSGAEHIVTRTWDDVTALRVATFERFGWTQTGWISDEETPRTFGLSPATFSENINITLFPVWTRNRSTLIINPNEGSYKGELGDTILNNDSTEYNRFGDTYELGVPTKEGHIFRGWAVSGQHQSGWNSETGVFTFGPAAGYVTTLTAIWEEETYTITYLRGAHGSGVEFADQKTWNVPVTLRGAIFTRHGYTQTGWATTDGGAQVYALNLAGFNVNDDVTLFPVWTINRSNLVIIPNGGIYNGLTENTTINNRDFNTTFTPDEPTRVGFDFVRWEIVSGSQHAAGWNPVTGVFTFGPTAGQTTTLRAVWQLITYTVTYQGSPPAAGFDGTLSTVTGSRAPDIRNYNDWNAAGETGTAFALPGVVFTVQGWVQIGWRLGGQRTVDGTVLPDDEPGVVFGLTGQPAPVNENQTFFPVWGRLSHQVDVILVSINELGATQVSNFFGSLSVASSSWITTNPEAHVYRIASHLSGGDVSIGFTLQPTGQVMAIEISYNGTDWSSLSGALEVTQASFTVPYITRATFVRVTLGERVGTTWERAFGASGVGYTLPTGTANVRSNESFAFTVTFSGRFSRFELDNSNVGNVFNIAFDLGTGGSLGSLSVTRSGPSSFLVTVPAHRDNLTFSVSAAWADNAANLNTYTILYLPGDGGSGSPVTVSRKWDEEVTLGTHSPVDDPVDIRFTRTGFEQIGWSEIAGQIVAELSDAEEAFELDARFNNNRDLILFPVWQANISSFVIAPNGGVYVFGSETGEHTNTNRPILQGFGSTYTIFAQPTRHGHTFTGWTVSGQHVAGWNPDTLTFTFGADATYVTTLTAGWSANVSTLVINLAGGSWTGGATNISGAFGGVAYSPDEPTRVGYTFTGWQASGQHVAGWNATNGTFTFGPDSGFVTTLTAQWTLNKSILIIDTGEQVTEEEMNFGDNYLVTAPTRAGYRFTGWIASCVVVCENDNLDDCLDECECECVCVDLQGWNVDTLRFTFGPTLGHITVLTAQWLQNRSTLVINLAGGTGVDNLSREEYSGATTSVGTPTFAGWTFRGWTVSGQHVSGWAGSGTELANGWNSGTFTFGDAHLAITTLTATWTRNRSTLVVDLNDLSPSGSFAVYGGVGTGTGITRDSGTAQGIPNPSRTGFTFNGWETNPVSGVNGTWNWALATGGNFIFGDADGGTTTLTAQWEAITHTVTFNQGNLPPENWGWDPANAEQAELTKLFFEGLRLPGGVGPALAFRLVGYTQIGWTTANITGGAVGASHITHELGGMYTANANVTLYPVWERNAYAITHTTGAGYVVTAPATVLHGDSTTFTVRVSSGVYSYTVPVVRLNNGAMLTPVSGSIGAGDRDWVFNLANITAVTAISVELLYTIPASFTNGSVWVDIECTGGGVGTATLIITIRPNQHHIITSFSIGGESQAAIIGSITYENYETTGVITINNATGVRAITAFFTRVNWRVTLRSNYDADDNREHIVGTGPQGGTIANNANSWSLMTRPGWRLMGWSRERGGSVDPTILYENTTPRDGSFVIGVSMSTSTYYAVWEKVTYSIVMNGSVGPDFLPTAEVLTPNATANTFIIEESAPITVTITGPRGILWQAEINSSGNWFFIEPSSAFNEGTGVTTFTINDALIRSIIGATLPGAGSVVINFRPVFDEIFIITANVGVDGSAAFVYGGQNNPVAGGTSPHPTFNVQQGVAVTATITPDSRYRIATATITIEGVDSVDLMTGATQTIGGMTFNITRTSPRAGVVTLMTVTATALTADITIAVTFTPITFNVVIQGVDANDGERIFAGDVSDSVSIEDPLVLWRARPVAGKTFSEFMIRNVSATVTETRLMDGAGELVFGSLSGGLMWLFMTETFNNSFINQSTGDIVILAYYNTEHTVQMVLVNNANQPLVPAVDNLPDDVEVFLTFNDGMNDDGTTRWTPFAAPWVGTGNVTAANTGMQIQVARAGNYTIRVNFFARTSGGGKGAPINGEDVNFNDDDAANGIFAFSLSADMIIEISLEFSAVTLVIESVNRAGSPLQEREILAGDFNGKWEIKSGAQTVDFEPAATLDGLAFAAWHIHDNNSGTWVNVALVPQIVVDDSGAVIIIQTITIPNATFANRYMNRFGEIVLRAIYSGQVAMEISVSDNAGEAWRNQFALKIGDAWVGGEWKNGTVGGEWIANKEDDTVWDIYDGILSVDTLAPYGTSVVIHPIPSRFYTFDLAGSTGITSLEFELLLDRNITLSFASKVFTMTVNNLSEGANGSLNFEEGLEFRVGDTITIAFETAAGHQLNSMLVGDKDASELVIPGMAFSNGMLTIDVTYEWLEAAVELGWITLAGATAGTFNISIEVDAPISTLVIVGVSAAGVVLLVVLIGIAMAIISIRRKRADYKAALEKHKTGMARLNQNLVKDLLKDEG